MTRRRTVLGAVLSAAMGASLVLLGPAPVALAVCGTTGCSPDNGTPTGGTDATQSSGTVRDSYTSAGQNCSVYANGTGMGAYCLGLGGGTAQSLRERFPGQVLDYCHLREIPAGVPAPFNANPDKGRYMLQICLQNVDFDTYSGGPNRSIMVDIAFVPWRIPVEDVRNGLNDFVWSSMSKVEQLPVPFMVTRPNPTPVVGTPTFFTFRWLDPATQKIVRDPRGPYGSKDNGGPFKQITTGTGLVMRAEATSMEIDPRQQGMKPITCDPGSPYIEGKPANAQPSDACKIVFDRSSAMGRELSTAPMPDSIGQSFFAMIRIHWKVTYGEPGDMRELGNGFDMRVAQGIRVQEIQAPNQPPMVIY